MKTIALFGFFFFSFASILLADVTPIQEIIEPTIVPSPLTHGKVAVLQWAGDISPLNVTREQAEEVKQKNRDIIASYAREARDHGADMLITPEFSVPNYPETDYETRDELSPYVETIPGPTTHYFSGIARELNMYLFVGLAELDASTQKFYNAMVVIGPQGNIVAKHRKMNLFSSENKTMSPGSTITVFDSPFGKIGILICADIYGRAMDEYRKARVSILTMSASWTTSSPMSWFQSLAQRNPSTLLVSNQPYYPDSGVINADGTLQSHIRQSVGLAYGYLPRSRTLDR